MSYVENQVLQVMQLMGPPQVESDAQAVAWAKRAVLIRNTIREGITGAPIQLDHLLISLGQWLAEGANTDRFEYRQQIGDKLYCLYVSKDVVLQLTGAKTKSDDLIEATTGQELKTP